MRYIRVSIQDEVEDGCLSNPNTLKVEAELILRKSGFTVEDTPRQYELRILAQGWETKLSGGQATGTCMATLNVDLERFALVPEGHVAKTVAYHHGGLLFVVKAKMQAQLRTWVSQIVSDLANEILKARGN